MIRGCVLCLHTCMLHVKRYVKNYIYMYYGLKVCVWRGFMIKAVRMPKLERAV